MPAIRLEGLFLFWVLLEWIGLSDQQLWRKPLGLSPNAISFDFMSLLAPQERQRKAGGER